MNAAQLSRLAELIHALDDFAAANGLYVCATRDGSLEVLDLYEPAPRYRLACLLFDPDTGTYKTRDC